MFCLTSKLFSEPTETFKPKQPDYCENFNLQDVTPVRIERFVQLLDQSGYDPREITFLHSRFTEGFDLGYEGPEARQSESNNILFMVGDWVDMWNKLMKEVRLGRVTGPFETIPFDNYIQSPIGLVPKARGDQTRLIFHLSYNFKDGLKSVTYLELCEELILGEELNQNISGAVASMDREQLKVGWRKHFHMHKRKKTIYAGKTDLKSAFRLLGLAARCWQWLVMKAEDPETGQWRFFVDKCLPFGASISCALFQRFSDALCHVIAWKVNGQRRIPNYLDDYLFIAATIWMCNYMIRSFLRLCKELGILVTAEKTEWASHLVTFLGILLDGRNYILVVPEEKRIQAIDMLTELLSKKKATVKQLQKLCGFLNFISRAVFPGRTFTRRMYSKYSRVVNLGDTPKNAEQFKFKQHHHVRLDREFKYDCEVWLKFLTDEQMSGVVN